MKGFANNLSSILSKWYRSKNVFFHFIANIIYNSIGLPFYWITRGKNQILSISKISKEMQRQGRVSNWKIKLDILFEFIFHVFLSEEYFFYNFERKTRKERKEFCSELDHWKFTNICNKREDIFRLRNKRISYELFKNFYKREQIIVKSIDDIEIYSDFILRHPTFFKKPLNGAGGVDSGWFKSSDYSSNLLSLEAITKNGAFVLEEGVNQCELMSRFNPDSINTLRIVTIRQTDKVINWFAFIRTGRKGCSVDNGGKGGIIVGVDINKGELCTDGFNENGETFKSHPDSGIVFKGFKLPYWDESINMTIKLMDIVPSINCIGWDIAFTDNGPIIIEANGQTALIGPQLTRQNGIRKEYDKIIANLPPLI